MIQNDVEAQDLEAHVVHQVVGLARRVLVLQEGLRGAQRFDDHLLDFHPELVDVLAHFTQPLEHARHGPFVADVHPLHVVVEAMLEGAAYTKFSLFLLMA